MPPFAAALQGAREVGFTVLAMSLSLIAVFIPILMMGGIIGRLFREFAITLSVAILVSLVVSLTTTPMMCARLLRQRRDGPRGRLYRWSERRIRGAAPRVPPQPRVRARARSVGDAGAARHCLPQCLPVRRHPQGFLPAAGYGTAGGRHTGGPEHLVPGDAPEAGRFHDHRQQRPRGGERRRLHRGRTAQFGLHVRRAEAADRARRDRRPGRRAAAREAVQGTRRQPVPAAGAGHPHRRAAQQCAVPVHAAGRRSRGTSRLGAEDPRRPERAAGIGRTSIPTPRTRACRPRWSSTATAHPGWGSAPA